MFGWDWKSDPFQTARHLTSADKLWAVFQSIWSSSMMHPGPSALEQLLMQQKQKQQRGQGTMNPPHWGQSGNPGNEGSINHGMLGLQDWPTQSPAGGSPLFCVSLLRGCKYSTSPLSVHEMSTVQQKEKTIRNSPSPRGLPEGERNCCLSHSATWYHRLSPSPSCMSPATWEVKAEKGRQMGEANGNFSVLFFFLFGE